MTFQNHRSLNSPHSKLSALFLALCLSVMTVLGAPLHDHDLDPFHADPDCIPCHVAQTGFSLEAESPELPVGFQVERWISNTASTWVMQAAEAPSSRSPPAFL